MGAHRPIADEAVAEGVILGRSIVPITRRRKPRTSFSAGSSVSEIENARFVFSQRTNPSDQNLSKLDAVVDGKSDRRDAYTAH
jgi:hypothetical protein